MARIDFQIREASRVARIGSQIRERRPRDKADRRARISGDAVQRENVRAVCYESIGGPRGGAGVWPREEAANWSADHARTDEQSEREIANGRTSSKTGVPSVDSTTSGASGVLCGRRGGTSTERNACGRDRTSLNLDL